MSEAFIPIMAAKKDIESPVHEMPLNSPIKELDASAGNQVGQMANSGVAGQRWSELSKLNDRNLEWLEILVEPG